MGLLKQEIVYFDVDKKLPQTIQENFYTPHSGNAFLKTLYFKTGLTLYLLIMIIQVQQLKYGATFTFHFL